MDIIYFGIAVRLFFMGIRRYPPSPDPQIIPIFGRNGTLAIRNFAVTIHASYENLQIKTKLEKCNKYFTKPDEDKVANMENI